LLFKLYNKKMNYEKIYSEINGENAKLIAELTEKRNELLSTSEKKSGKELILLEKEININYIVLKSLMKGILFQKMKDVNKKSK
jgi:hypothetical protein